MIAIIISVVAYLVVGGLVGGVLSGIDRKISARMQGRVGPPLMQPFYDVFKLFEKENRVVNRIQDFYVLCFFLLVLAMGAFFFAGQSLLLVIFTLTLGEIFLIMAAYSSNSPYAQIGAERELLSMMAYEPMMLIMAVGLYIHTRSFNVAEILSYDHMSIYHCLGLFLGMSFILTIKLRKAHFDLSMSHHAHQELVGGLKTEFSGSTLALMEVAHWYENIIYLGCIFIFFGNGEASGYIIGALVTLVVFFIEVLIGNSFARVKWEVLLKTTWVVTFVAGGINLFALMLIH